MNEILIGCTSDKLWNRLELLKFLINHQQKHIVLWIRPEAICLTAIGVYDLLDLFEFLQVDIHTDNPLETHDRYNIIYKQNPWLKKQEKIDTSLHIWNGAKTFLCLFHRPTASRLGIGAHIYKNHLQCSHLHFSAEIDNNALIQFELDKLLEYHIPSIEPAGILINQLPLLKSPSDRLTSRLGYDYADPLTKLYQDILIDIVVESHVLGNTFYPTEKTTRPIWLKKPFIIFGSKNYLDYLHQLGFKTFYEFWSEDYDGYEGRDRYVKILQLIDNLAKKSTVELTQIYQDMQSILDYNYNLLMTQSYNTNISYIP